MKARADLAIAAYEALKTGAAAPPATASMSAPQVATSGPVATGVPSAAAQSTASREEIEAAKQKAQLLTWAAEKLAGEGAPQAPAMKARADLAVAAYEALKSGAAQPAGQPVVMPPSPRAAAAVPAAAVARPPASKQEIAAAKQKA